MIENCHLFFSENLDCILVGFPINLITNDYILHISFTGEICFNQIPV